MKKTMLGKVLKTATIAILLSSIPPQISAYTVYDDQIPVDSNGCDYCEEGYSYPFTLQAEYLNWHICSSPRIIPLVFTGIFDEDVTPTLKTAGTEIVLGNRKTKDDGRSGAKFTIGYTSLFCTPFIGEVTYHFIGKQTSSKSVRSNDYREDKRRPFPSFPDNSYLAIPFFDVVDNQDSSVYIAKPEEFAGKATLRVSNWIQGLEFNLLGGSELLGCCFFGPNPLQLRGLAGFRYWNFNDKLTFKTHSPDLTTPDVFTTIDEFKTINTFYGGQLGVEAFYVFEGFFFNARLKLALGGMNQQLSIDGELLTNDFNQFEAVESFTGGYFALPTNIGNYEKTRFAYIPEVCINLGYQFTDCLSIRLGYSFLYVSQVFWAENQIDPNINPTQSVAINRSTNTNLEGRASPRPQFKSRDLSVQGLNVGLEYRF